MSDEPHQLEFALRKLRHLYEQMVNGHLRTNQEDHARIANGLLSPAIADIERYIAKTTPHVCMNDKLSATLVDLFNFACGIDGLSPPDDVKARERKRVVIE